TAGSLMPSTGSPSTHQWVRRLRAVRQESGPAVSALYTVIRERAPTATGYARHRC
ncbi:hypothetical protein EVJ58_g9740, partial [Rhodofomes roseus]